MRGGAGKVDIANGVTSPSLLTRPDLLFLYTSEGEQIPAIHREVPGAPFTILYSHGNGQDLGVIFELVAELADTTGCSVLAYDYVGYSLSRLEGLLPSEDGCYRSVQCAFDHLVEYCRIPPSSIVLYGVSIGSGPTVEMASRPCAVGCAGVVLESPIASGARVGASKLSSGDLQSLLGKIAQPFDLFINYQKIGSVACPVGIVHGTADDVVPVGHGQELYANCRERSKRPPLWLEGYGHNNMPRDQCLAFFCEFLKGLQEAGSSGAGTDAVQASGVPEGWTAEEGEDAPPATKDPGCAPPDCALM